MERILRKHAGKRLISMLLTLAMVLGLLPAISMPLFAAVDTNNAANTENAELH